VPLQLGPELLVNGDFSTGAVWVPGVGWVIAAGIATVTLPATASSLAQPVSIITGRTYLSTFVLSSYVGGSVRVRLQNSGMNAGNQVSFFANGACTALLTASATANEFAFFVPNSLASLSVDSVSLRLVL